ncbi:MAG: dihydroneopterin aldolase family protein [Halobacteria archaeon]|nr:dihydroneopterin aldolase family protein [Halobacteria archaeon]
MNDETETGDKDGEEDRSRDGDGDADEVEVEDESHDADEVDGREDCEACFEAGIKLGALYHQFTGTPISDGSAESLETAIEEAVGNQRYVEEVGVEIRGIEPNRFGYSELEGEMVDVSLVVEKEGVVVEASMSEEDGYPMMRVDEVLEEDEEEDEESYESQD